MRQSNLLKITILGQNRSGRNREEIDVFEIRILRFKMALEKMG